MSAQDADQTVGRHRPVFRMVGQSKGTLYKHLKESQRMLEMFTHRLVKVLSLMFAGEVGQHGKGIPAQETLVKATVCSGHFQTAGCQRRRLQLSEDQQWLQQGKDSLCCE